MATAIPVVPLFDESAVRHALERLRQAESLGSNPLRALIWIRGRIEAGGPMPSPATIEVALGTALTEIIEQNLSHHRKVQNLPHATDAHKEAALEALHADFGQGNAELEAWSILYYRYVRIDLNLQVNELAFALKVTPRHLGRRLTRGYRRLTEILSRHEQEARLANRHLWLRSKLPPVAYSELFGVEEHLTRLHNLLTSNAPPRLVALVGPGGIGKTTLAHAVTRRLIEDGVFDEVNWLTLNVPTAYHTLLMDLARQAGYPHLATYAQPDLEAALRVRLSASPSLLVLDNAGRLEGYGHALAHLSELVNVGRVLLIARQRPPYGAALHLVNVAPLARDDIAKLLRHQARLNRASRIDLGEDGIDRIYRSIGGNPLAARLVAGQLSALPLARVLDNLSALSTTQGERLFDLLFVPTWEAFSVEARQTALALCLLPSQGATWYELHPLVPFTSAALDQALGDLITSSFVDVLGEEPQYVMHTLARHFVEEQAVKPANIEKSRLLLRRAVKHRQQKVPHVEEVIASDLEQEMILINRQTESDTNLEALGDFVAQIAPAARRLGNWVAWRNGLLRAAERLRFARVNPLGLALVLREIGIAHRWLGDVEAAADALIEAVAIFGERGDLAEQIETLLELGQVYDAEGEAESAQAAYQRAAATAQYSNNPEQYRRALKGLAGVALHYNQVYQALALLQEALEAYEDEPPDGQLLSALGAAELQAGRSGEALDYQTRALEVFEAERDLPDQARVQIRLGIAYASAGQHDLALTYLQDGLALVRALGDALGQARALTNLGTLYHHMERREEALDIWLDALALQRHLGDQVGMAHTWYNLADLEWSLGRAEQARHAMQEAQSLAEQFQVVTLREQIAEHPLMQAGDESQE